MADFLASAETVQGMEEVLVQSDWDGTAVAATFYTCEMSKSGARTLWFSHRWDKMTWCSVVECRVLKGSGQ